MFYIEIILNTQLYVITNKHNFTKILPIKLYDFMGHSEKGKHL